MELIVIGKWVVERNKGDSDTPNCELKLSIHRHARTCPDVPDCARLRVAMTLGLKPFPHAPVLRMTLVGKAQTPSN